MLTVTWHWMLTFCMLACAPPNHVYGCARDNQHICNCLQFAVWDAGWVECMEVGVWSRNLVCSGRQWGMCRSDLALNMLESSDTYTVPFTRWSHVMSCHRDSDCTCLNGCSMTNCFECVKNVLDIWNWGKGIWPKCCTTGSLWLDLLGLSLVAPSGA